jgi:hypothetical protein
MNNMQKQINIKVGLPLEQYNAFIKNISVTDIKINYNIYEFPTIDIDIPNISSITIHVDTAKEALPTNEEITTELCTPDECLSPGRGLFAKDVLNEITEDMINSINPSKGILRKERSSFSISTIGKTKQDIGDWKINLHWNILREINKVCNKYADTDLWKIKLSNEQFTELLKTYVHSEVLYKKNGNSVINNVFMQNKEFEIVENLENCIIIEPIYL